MGRRSRGLAERRAAREARLDATPARTLLAKAGRAFGNTGVLSKGGLEALIVQTAALPDILGVKLEPRVDGDELYVLVLKEKLVPREKPV